MTTNDIEKVVSNVRLDQRNISDDLSEIRLFGKMKNEILRIKHFLHWYRTLGVSRFFIVDNGSTDGTLEFLSTQADVHLFSNAGNMRYSAGGVAWITPLMNEYGNGHWCIVADADEFLVYPDCEMKSIANYCGELSEGGFDALYCMMIDMYPDGSLDKAKYHSEGSLITFSPYFDRSGYTSFMTEDGNMIIRGGPRLRMFFPELVDPSKWTLLKRKILNKASHEFACLARFRPILPPIISKAPLVRWNPSLRFSGAAHWLISPAKFAPGIGALLHFKFLGDFLEKVNNDRLIQEYAGGGVDYKIYREALNKMVEVNFMCELTERYRDSKQLVSLGLIR